MAIPILGNLINVIIAGNIVNFLEENRKVYGNVFTIELGGLTRVVISKYDIIYDLLVKNADFTSNRTANSMPRNFRHIAIKYPGVFWAPYPEWKTMRSFALSTLREEGMGKAQLEPKIMEETNLYIDHFIEPNIGKPIDMTKSIGYATANIISGMVIGRRFDYNDEIMLALNEAMDKSVKSNVKASITQNIPLVRFLPGDLTGFKESQEAGDFSIPTIRGWVEKEAKTMDRNAPQNFIEQALVYSLKEDENGNAQTCFNEGNTAIATMHLYAAGTETTATAIRWVLLYMVLYPDIQEKCRREIDENIGQRPVTYRDRVNLPYVEAAILECFRVSNIAPQGLPRTLDKEMIIEGKKIPVGTELMINMTSILYDPNVFPDPLKFDPDRYFGSEGAMRKSLVQPFGLGRRACLGEALAKMEMFIFFTTFLQRYAVRHVDNVKPSVIPTCSIVNMPQPYDVIFDHR